MFFRKYEHKVKIGKKSLERKEVLTLLVDHVTGKIISLSAVLSKLMWKYIIIIITIFRSESSSRTRPCDKKKKWKEKVWNSMTLLLWHEVTSDIARYTTIL